MDAWGVDGCAERRGEILARLRKEYGKRGWLDTVKAAALAGKVQNAPLPAAPAGPVAAVR